MIFFIGCMALILIGFFTGSHIAIKDNNDFYKKYVALEDKTNKEIEQLKKEKISLQARLKALEINYPLALEYKKEQSKRRKEIAERYKKTFRGWGMRLQLLLEEEHITHKQAVEIFRLKSEQELNEYIACKTPKIEHLIAFMEYFKPDLNWFILGE